MHAKYANRCERLEKSEAVDRVTQTPQAQYHVIGRDLEIASCESQGPRDCLALGMLGVDHGIIQDLL